MKLPPIHEIGKFQRHPLNLTALSAGDAEGVNLGRRRRSIMRRKRHVYSYKEEMRNVDEQCRSMSRSTTHLVMDSGDPITRRMGRVFKHNRAKTITGENLLATVCIF
jgi:hypothetical protein